MIRPGLAGFEVIGDRVVKVGLRLCKGSLHEASAQQPEITEARHRAAQAPISPRFPPTSAIGYMALLTGIINRFDETRLALMLYFRADS